MVEVFEGPLGTVIVVAALLMVATSLAILFRVPWLRSSGRSPDAPTLGHLLFGDFGAALYWFVMSSRHRQLGDPLTTGLIWMVRLALAATMVATCLAWMIILSHHLR